jgi:hypothetical protein
MILIGALIPLPLSSTLTALKFHETDAEVRAFNAFSF